MRFCNRGGRGLTPEDRATILEFIEQLRVECEGDGQGDTQGDIRDWNTRPPYRPRLLGRGVDADDPSAMTCGTCLSFLRCRWLLSRTGAETACDWTPSRYRPPMDCDGGVR